MKKNNETNGHTEINLIENVDYFNMADGLYLTVEAINKKYNIAKSTAYNKAREHNIPMKKIAGNPCFLDHKGFKREERDYKKFAESGEKVPSYAGLFHLVNSESELNRLHRNAQEDWNREINFKYDSFIQQLIQVKEIMQQILDHLTKEKNG